MIGRLAATNCSIGTSAVVCAAVVEAPARVARSALIVGLFSRSKSPVAVDPVASELSSQQPAAGVADAGARDQGRGPQEPGGAVDQGGLPRAALPSEANG